MIPQFNVSDGISTPDFLFKNEKWDLKTILSDKEQALYRAIHKKSKQSSNFIFDMSNSKLSNEMCLGETERLFSRNDTIFLDKAIIIKDKQIIKIYERKKRKVGPRR